MNTDSDRAGALPHEAYLAALASLPDVGPGTLRRLLTLGAPAEVWALVAGGGVPSDLLSGAHATRGDLTARWVRDAARCPPAEVWERCRRQGVGVTSLGAPGYPAVLAADPEPPVVLFHLGSLDALSRPAVAVVGTRKATGYGRRVAHDLGRALAAAGLNVVSGLALGIDAAAHAGALDAACGADAGAPVAVVAAGLDAPGPARNAALARAVARRGAVLSEVPPGVPASPWRFPVRNRILAGLSDAVIVVESAGRGGSMSTVGHALSRDIPVLAVPGPVDSESSEGTNALIADGATPCTDVSDVLCLLGLSSPAPDAKTAVEVREDPQGDSRLVLDTLGWRPETAERLARATGLPLPRLAVALGWLTDNGWVSQSGGFVERIARASHNGSGPLPGHP